MFVNLEHFKNCNVFYFFVNGSVSRSQFYRINGPEQRILYVPKKISLMSL